MSITQDVSSCNTLCPNPGHHAPNRNSPATFANSCKIRHLVPLLLNLRCQQWFHVEPKSRGTRP